MAELMDHVGALADQIGPRPVSTEEEHQTSLYIADELTADGLDTSIDEFATPTGVRWPYAVAFGVVALGVIVSGIGIFVPAISLSMLIVGLILVLAGVFVYYTEYNNRPFLSKMRAGGVSQNVVAKYIPQSVARETRRRKVIIVAHVDTVRAQPEAGSPFIERAPLLRKILFYCMFGIAAVTFIRVLPLPWPEVIDQILWVISLLACVFILGAAGCIIANRFMPFVSGGNDNASSVAVMLSVAQRLVDPEARERYAMERPIVKDNEYYPSALDTDVDADNDDAFNPDEPDLDEPVMHDENSAIEAGVVPEGAKIAYDDDGLRDDATVAFPMLSPEEQLNVLADTAAADLKGQDDADKAYSLDDVESEPATNLGGIPEIKVPELDFNLDEGADAPVAKPAEKLDDSVVFAEYLSEDKKKAEETPNEPQRLEASEFAELDFGETETDEVVEAQNEEPALAENEDGSEEKPAPAPVYTPIAPAQPKRERRKQQASAVPSWYLSAKEKAAKDKKERAEENDTSEASGAKETKETKKAKEAVPNVYRSRFADMPARPSGAFAARAAHEEPERSSSVAAEPDQDEARAALQQDEAAASEVQAAAEAPDKQPELELGLEPKPEPVLDLEIPDDQLDELSPDTSGLFARVKKEPEFEPEKGEGKVTDLTTRIPNIGSSDDKVREERRALQEERAAREVRPELQEIPAILDKEAAAKSTSSEAKPASKPARKTPTARHLTEEFTPTRAVDARSNRPFGDNRQEAPVSSTYEDTPQASPSFDPFAPKDERYVDDEPEYRAPRSRAGLSGRMPSVGSSDFSATQSSPAMTGSFPSLTGSFPALSGSIPTVNANDFTEAVQPGTMNDDAIDDFMAAGKTTEINIPESRLHNAADKIGGLFNRRKGGKNNAQDAGQDDWGEDDFGWKGGAYYDGEAASAFDAARERAAQIRDSVVTMTESDLLDKEVWFVALGASSAGAQGMKNFLDLHASELRGSLIINLEAVGAGQIHYIDMEGTGKPNRSDRRLQSLVKKAAKDLKGSEMKPKSLEWRNTDATPAMIEGMRAITLMGFAENGVAPVNWHTADDTSDIVDENNLEYVTRLLLNVIENS